MWGPAVNWLTGEVEGSGSSCKLVNWGGGGGVVSSCKLDNWGAGGGRGVAVNWLTGEVEGVGVEL